MTAVAAVETYGPMRRGPQPNNPEINFTEDIVKWFGYVVNYELIITQWLKSFTQ